nr:unnamed protein product [Spirometra erinaceieuropaei]
MDDAARDFACEGAMFADDMKIWSVIRGPADDDRLQMNLNRLEEWSNRWLLRFNVAKCSILRLGSTDRSASPRGYFLGGAALQEVEAQKDLVPVTVTGRSKRELSNEESQPPAIGETKQRTRIRKTGRYDSVLRPLTLHAYRQCLWPLPAGLRGSCRLRRANHRRLEKLTNEGADGRLEVPVAVTGRSKRELAIEERHPSTSGETNQRRRRRKTGSACGRYRPVKEGAVVRELTIVESQPWTTGKANHERHGRKTGSAGSRYWPVIEGTVDCGEPTMDDWGSQPMKVRTEDWKCRWPLLAGHRRNCRLWNANHGRLEEPTMEGAEGRLVVPVAVTVPS